MLFFIIQPSYFPKDFEYKILFVVFISTYIIPILFLFILKRKKAIASFHLSTIEERKLPVLFFLVITILLGYRLQELHVINLLAHFFLLGSVSLLIVYFLLYINLKVSLHTLAIGGLLGFVLVMSYEYKMNLLLLIIGVVLLFGLIAAARLKLKAHTALEVYLGFILGVLIQTMAFVI